MRSSLCASLFVVASFIAAPALPLQAAGVLPPEAAAALLADRGRPWVEAFTAALAAVQAGDVLVAQAMPLALEAVRGRPMPDDPAEAAALVVAAVRQVDVALRRGVSPSLLRLQVRAAWDASSGSPRGFSLDRGRGGRGDAAPGHRSNGAWNGVRQGRAEDPAGESPLGGGRP